MMKNVKTIQTIALIAMLCCRSFTLADDKRTIDWPSMPSLPAMPSMPSWPSFTYFSSWAGAGGSTDAGESEQPVVEESQQEEKLSRGKRSFTLAGDKRTIDWPSMPSLPAMPSMPSWPSFTYFSSWAGAGGSTDAGESEQPVVEESQQEEKLSRGKRSSTLADDKRTIDWPSMPSLPAMPSWPSFTYFSSWGGAGGSTDAGESEQPVVEESQQEEKLSRRKRSFFWPSFFGGGGASTDVEVEQADIAAPVEDFQVPPQHPVEIPIQHLTSGNHYPIWRVHKYNGIELKPMPISLVERQHAQQIHNQPLHTQVPLTQLQQLQQFNQFLPNQVQPVAAQHQNGQQFSKSNCRPQAASSAIPPELQELADQFGIKDVSKLPSLEDAMGLLGTTTRAETIQTIKELAATRDGMSLIRQFLASDDGAAASSDPNTSSECNDALPTQQFIPQQPNNVNVPNPQMFIPNGNSNQDFVNAIPSQVYAVPNQAYGVPNQAYGVPNQAYGVPNQAYGVPNQAYGVPNQAYGVPNQAYGVPNPYPHEEYGVPNELATAHTEHQGYNRNFAQSQIAKHEVYGLPYMKPAVEFNQQYYAPRSNAIESVKHEEKPHKEYNVPNEISNSEHKEPVPHQEYGVPNHEESQAQEQSVQQHEVYGLPKETEAVSFHHTEPHQEYGVPKNEESQAQEQSVQQHEVYGLPKETEAASFHHTEPHQEYGVPKNEESHANEQSVSQHEVYGLPNEQEAVNFQSTGLYPPKTDSIDFADNEAIVGHKEYNVPNEETHTDHQTQVPHEVYGIPNEFQVPNTDNNLQFVQPHQVHSVPEQTINEQDKITLNTHETYGVPNREFDHHENENIQHDQQDVSIPSQELVVPSVSDTQAPIIAPHGSFALPHQRFFEPNTFTKPHYQQQLSGLHDMAKQNTQYGAPTQTNNNHLTHVPILTQIDGTEFAMPAASNLGPIARVQYPLSVFNTPSDLNDYGLPNLQPQPFDGQTVEEFVPDISQFPLDQRNLGNDLLNSYGNPAYPHSYAGDSNPAASETSEKQVSVVLPKKFGKYGNRIETEEMIDNAVKESKKKYGPQRVSSYDY